jgi:hypothetical protein
MYAYWRVEQAEGVQARQVNPAVKGDVFLLAATLMSLGYRKVEQHDRLRSITPWRLNVAVKTCIESNAALPLQSPALTLGGSLVAP